MKRLTIFALVFALTGTANAYLWDGWITVNGGTDPGPSYDLEVNTSVQVELYSGNTDTGVAYIGFEDNGLYSIDSVAVTTNAGDEGGYYGPYTYYGYSEIELSVGPTATPGVMLEVDITAGASTGTVDVYILLSDFFITYDTLTLNIVPEPVTLVLLGAGGLALIRRRRK